MTLPIFLLSDFGLRDTCVGQMKAVLLGHAPGAALVDLTHEATPFDIAEGAWLLETALPALPAACVVLAVVDPGVGTARRPLAVVRGKRIFIGPDNGLLSSAFRDSDGVSADASTARAFELTATGPRRPTVSATFHGRDIFAPAAAACALGRDPATMGPAIDEPVVLAPFRGYELPGGRFRGEVIHIDRYGTAVSTIRAEQVAQASTVCAAGQELRMARTFADAPPGSALALIDSSGFLALAVNQGSAAAVFSLNRGTEVVVRA